MSAENSWLLQGGTLVTLCPEQPVVAADLLVRAGKIAALGNFSADDPRVKGVPIRDVSGCIVMPGLVQAHIHLCQTLARGLADDLPLLRWLNERVLPYEAALSEKDLVLATQVGVAELLLSGTTSFLDMGTVRHHDALCETVFMTGIRASVGQALMDHPDTVSANLRKDTQTSLGEADAVCRRWHGKGRLRYAYAPRFLVSCTDELMRGVAERVGHDKTLGLRIHTHASEQLDEVELIRKRTGQCNVMALRSLAICGRHTVLAHCVHVTEQEMAALRDDGTHVAHCPSSNLKLGSGIAQVSKWLTSGLNVAIGADGAPCNNRLDGFSELRLCALLQKGLHGSEAVPAWQALHLATMGGASALGLSDEIGSLAIGKQADVIVLSRDRPGLLPLHDPVSTLVYANAGADVRDVFVGGEMLVSNRRLTARTGLDEQALSAACAARMPEILGSVGNGGIARFSPT